MEEVRIIGSVDLTTIYRPNPFVHVKTVRGSESIWPPISRVIITKKRPYPDESTCEIKGKLVSKSKDFFTVKVESEEGDIELEIPPTGFVTTPV